MLSEIKRVSQIPGEPKRRWFRSKSLDLVIWYTQTTTITGFQLCYHDGTSERALTYQSGHGLSRKIVDTGDQRVNHHKMTPILIPGDHFLSTDILAILLREGTTLDTSIISFIQDKLR